MENIKIRNKILMDLFVAWDTLAPFLIGVTSFFAGVAIRHPIFYLLGISGFLISAGIFTTKLLFGLEEMTAKAVNAIDEEKKEERKEYIKNLRTKLYNANEGEARDYLVGLVDLYNEFQLSANDEGNHFQSDIGDKIEKIYNACIKQIEYVLELSRLLKKTKINGQINEIKQKRHEVLEEIAHSIDDIADAIHDFKDLKFDNKDGDLSKLRKELNDSVEIARNTELRMKELLGESPEPTKE